jgi:hypothetical protein
MLPDVALIIVEPAPADVASPLEPGVLLIVDTRVSDVFQITDEETSIVDVSDNVAMAMNCWVCPRAMLGFTGVTVIDDRMACVTVSVAEGLDVMLKNVAAMVAAPWLTAVAKPREPAALLIVAMPVVDVAQEEREVKVCVAPSASVPIDVNCWVKPLAMLALSGDTVIDDRVDELNRADPDFPS